ncbi:Nematocyte expressed protein 6 [Exaiptasia diaphana]|nr:Nematocyte expressed protein 6 [Exaiptasia diaphana]
MKCFLPLLFLGAFYLTNAKPVKEHLEIIEGDMLLTKEQKMIHDQLKGGRVRRAALKDQFLWPKGRVFYTFKDLGMS